MRDEVKIVVGGALISQKFVGEIGVDDYGEKAVEAVRLVKKLVVEN
jgi:methanogenic corrinoid protein MtbC1